MKIDALETILNDFRLKGIHPKFIYTMPTIQNPTGCTLELDRRWNLLRLAAIFDIPIIEDECYSNLVWRRDIPPPLYALERTRVIHVGSLSKSLAPALRLGFIAADWEVLSQVVACKTDGGTGALEQLVAAEYLLEGFDHHISEMAESLENKLDILVDALIQEFGTAIEFVRPEGGTFVWAKLPTKVDVKSLAGAAARLGISFNPGPDWACEPDKGNSHMRLCFALPSPDQIRTGVAELARACFEMYGIPATFPNSRPSPNTGLSDR
jgi:2-aminoadipate transaminase